MSNELFRKEALDKLNSPQEFNKSVKVLKPSVWIILLASIVLIAGVLVFTFVAQVEVKADVLVKVNDGHATAFVKDKDAQSIFMLPQNERNIQYTFNDEVDKIIGYDLDLVEIPTDINEDTYKEIIETCHYEHGEQLKKLTAQTNLQDGLYLGFIVTSVIKVSNVLFN